VWEWELINTVDTYLMQREKCHVRCVSGVTSLKTRVITVLEKLPLVNGHELLLVDSNSVLLASTTDNMSGGWNTSE
jgi:hypothetical protein